MTITTSQRCSTYSMSSGGLAGSSTTPAFLSDFADAGQRAVQMDRGTRLGLNEEVIGPRFGKRVEVAFGLDHHEMQVDGLFGRPPDRLYHDRTDGDIRHEPAVHHVDMNPIGARRVDGAHLFAKPRKIGRQDRWRDQDGRQPVT